jgi:ssDNA-binding replication factor A large subunit
LIITAPLRGPGGPQHFSPAEPWTRTVRSVERSYKRIEGMMDRDVFDREVDGIVEGSGSMFTNELAAMMVVDRLGRSEVRVPSLDHVRPGVTTVVRGFVARVVSVREFEREGRTQTVANVLLKDGTGQIVLVLWDDNAQMASSGDLSPGVWVRAANINVKRERDVLEAHASRSATVYIEEETVDLVDQRDAAFDVEWTPLADLREGEFVSARGEVVVVRGPRTFRRRDGSKGRVLNLTIFDNEAMAILVLWDDLAETFSSVAVGDRVEMLYGFVRVNRGALEIHSKRESLFRCAE